MHSRYGLVTTTISLRILGILFTFAAPAAAQLDFQLSVAVARTNLGEFQYDYTLVNRSTSLQSINSILLTTGHNAPIQDIVGPNENWVTSYAMEQELFQAGFATGLSDNGEECGAINDEDIFPGETVNFSLRSPWAPSPQRFAIGRTVGIGDACDFVGDAGTGFVFAPTLALRECDFDADGTCSVADIDTLSWTIQTQGPNSSPELSRFDLNLDNQLDTSDLLQFLAIVDRPNGDVDLNGHVEFADFLAVANNFAKPALWSGGDFNASGVVDFEDFLTLSGNFGASHTSTSLSVPEPQGIFRFGWLIWLLSLLLGRRGSENGERNWRHTLV